MKIKKGMKVEDGGKIWIIRSIANGLVMISEKGRPRSMRRYIKLHNLQVVPV